MSIYYTIRGSTLDAYLTKALERDVHSLPQPQSSLSPSVVSEKEVKLVSKLSSSHIPSFITCTAPIGLISTKIYTQSHAIINMRGNSHVHRITIISRGEGRGRGRGDISCSQFSEFTLQEQTPPSGCPCQTQCSTSQ